MNTARVRDALTHGFVFFLFPFPSGGKPSLLPRSHHKPGGMTQVGMGTPSRTDAEDSHPDLNTPSGSASSPVWPPRQVPHPGMSAPRAALAAAHTKSGRQSLTHGLNESPPKVGQPIGQPATAMGPTSPFPTKGWQRIWTSGS